MTPPAWDGTCGPQEAAQRRWGRILARVVVFGGMILLSAAIFCGIYLVVKVLK